MGSLTLGHNEWISYIWEKTSHFDYRRCPFSFCLSLDRDVVWMTVILDQERGAGA